MTGSQSRNSHLCQWFHIEKFKCSYWVGLVLPLSLYTLEFAITHCYKPESNVRTDAVLYVVPYYLLLSVHTVLYSFSPC